MFECAPPRSLGQNEHGADSSKPKEISCFFVPGLEYETQWKGSYKGGEGAP